MIDRASFYLAWGGKILKPDYMIRAFTKEARVDC